MPYPLDKDVPYRLERQRTALLIVDMQNDFVRTGAPLEVPEARRTIPANQELIEAARSADMPVLYTRFLAGPTYTLVWEWSPVLGPETRCCWPGHLRTYEDANGELDCSEVIDELAPLAGDLIIEKYGYNSFFQTNAAARLEALGRDMLIVTGTVTQICVEDTVRGAFHHGLRTVVARDAVSSYDAELHTASLRSMDMKYARVLSNVEILNELGLPASHQVGAA